MEVVSACKKNPDAPFMTLDLLFMLEDRPGQVVEILYSEDGLKKAWNSCCNELGDIIFLEDCTYKQMREGFIEYIHQEYREFKSKLKEQANQGQFPAGGSTVGKRTIHFSTPTIEKIGNEYFFIAKSVFNLTSRPVREMTADELKELPVILS